MDAKKIDIFNIILVVVSLIVAILIPFELFLFSYVILGPLHYLTEINWLHKKRYFFSANIKWSLLFLLLTVLISIYPVIKFIDLGLTQSVDYILVLIGRQSHVLLLIGFLFSLSLLFFKKIKDLLAMLFFAIVLSYTWMAFFPDFFIFITVFLPTIIHVYLFTLLFILYGAIKGKSKYGIYLTFTILAVPFVISYFPIDIINHQPSNKTTTTFIDSNMLIVGTKIAELFNKLENGKFLLLSEIGIRIQIFIAFAYTYHYLNWFSKTAII